MSLPPLFNHLRLPAVASPMFIISNPKMVIEQCKAGIVGSFPALNARPQEKLGEWLTQIEEELDAYNQANPDAPAAPYAVNQIVHRSNSRLMEDLEVCVKHKVPIVITSLGAREEVNEVVHSYGGIVLHDIINNRFAKKAVEKGADGLIAVAAGAGGHAGVQSPLALIAEIREWFDGPLLLSGAISTGSSILAAQAMGADLGYIGSAFIASHEANADSDYKKMIVDCGAEDIIYTDRFTGVHGNYLIPSLVASGIDPRRVAHEDRKKMDFGKADSDDNESVKAWKSIWGSGQGIGSVKSIASVSEIVRRLAGEYESAKERLAAL
ncbi:NAD(P)H-dependent flavin oxidoreductase [Cohaesibacter gelatinilyticus]|uniref:Nitronate monooxygenase n=1 Tax=Cohaesibacter gelatinilyticus TaxID=372072 RepID=A0A285NC67_9HYPH|nr:nitronate monooxygenase family protein [Cohaesibacter gelatinilyticus]SNZ06878.1 nitronate monooxygenase [Cohaesibacter gelatinilyticus]